MFLNTGVGINGGIEKILTQGFEKNCFQKGESKHRPRPICHVLEGG